MKIIKGDLIKLALAGEFDVIVHGCNCFCTQKSGIAKQMVDTFRTDIYPMEENRNGDKHRIGDITKLGNIEFGFYKVINNIPHKLDPLSSKEPFKPNLTVVNAYTQYYHLGNMPNTMEIPVDYNAIYLCFCKIAKQFKGKKIGIPKIGSGLARGNWEIIIGLIGTAFDRYGDINDLTVVEYE